MADKKNTLKLDIPTVSVIAVCLIAAVCIALICFFPPFSAKKGGTADTEKISISYPVLDTVPDLSNDFPVEYKKSRNDSVYSESGIDLIFTYASFPVIELKDSTVAAAVNEAISSYIILRTNVNESEKALAKEAYERSADMAEGFIPYEFRTDLKSVFVKGQYLSVLFSYQRTVGINEPAVVYEALNFDLSTGKSVSFSDIVSFTEADAEDYLITVFSQHISGSPEGYYSDVLEHLEFLIDLNAFYLNERGFVFYFPSETIAPSVF